MYAAYAVSKLHLYQELSKSLNPARADTVLFLITLQLYTQPDLDSEPAHGELYVLLKAACADAERNNVFSIRSFQATLLVALYEIANAIYPAAYLTVGHCARLSQMIGLHCGDKSPQIINPSSKLLHTMGIWMTFLTCVGTATELEERRRAWWSIIILDR